MGSARSSRPDWRDAEAYAALRGADRSLIAWEWLRRDTAYVSAWEAAWSAGSDAGAALFGLVAFEAPDRSVPEARPLWRADIHPFVLLADREEPEVAADALDLGSLGGRAVRRQDEAGDHLLLSDGWRAIRLDGPPRTFAGPSVSLGYRIHGLASAAPPLLTLRRLLALCRRGRFSRQLHPAEPRAPRWIRMLRAWDGLSSGASQREIAEVLLGRPSRQARWRSREPSLRSQAQRLVRSARRFGAGDYRRLLTAKRA